MLQQFFIEKIEKALISEGIISPDQLVKARKIQEQLGGEKTLQEVLVEMHWISGPRLDEFIRRQRSKLRTGEILVGRHLVSERDVQAALETQRRAAPRAKRIGEILIGMGLIEERHVIEALSEKFNLSLLDPDI